MLETAKMLAKLNIEGVKIHQLSLLKNTYLEKYFKEKKWKPFIFEEFIETVIKFIELLPPEMIIHRFSGSGYPRDILAPIWARDPNKNKIVKIIKEELLKKKSHQGFLFRKSSF